ncbi:hypothetical protein F3Y22_tig00110556pilonHSYRG00327 [Hibiscus syriacus]|uniref:Retrotransposon gag domain-containing protein n=1 Tax=Hibiscus syriacus TaxID=106335 RepID=A0A6A3A858_HIBSY|nr:hypothetical protein F3Y22_tig00110556pilonHSYRG00327 [Hibiscus syriacus]
MDKKFYDRTKYDAAKEWHPEGTSMIEESYAPKDRMPIEEQKEIRQIREQMSKMMERIYVLTKEKEIPAQKDIEINEHNLANSYMQGTSDPNQLEKLQIIIIRNHKSSGDTKEMMTTVKDPREEKKLCNLKSSKFSLLPTSKTQVQSKTKGGSHVDAIPISYKELYENLLEEDFQKINQAFRNAGIENTPEEWITGVTKLKKSCNIHEDLVQELLEHKGLPQVIRKEASDSIPDGSNQIIQRRASDKEEITDKEQPCCQIEESKMIIFPGVSHSNPRNSLVNYSQYEEKFKKMDEAIRNMKSVNASHKELEARELSLVPDLVIPHEFKMPDFEKYNGTSCPLIHLKMFCRKMEGYLSSDDLLIHSFHDSLSGTAVVWYNQLTQEQIKRWVDLVDAFLEQHRYVKGLTPTRMNLQVVKKKVNERFQEYALKWRGVAAQVQPLMLEKEISRMFRDSLPASFFELMQTNPTKEFKNLVTSGELIENIISEENSKVTSKSPTDQKAKADDVNKCCIQSPCNCKRKRANNCSDRPKKVTRSRKTLEVFQTSISDLYPHLIKGQYITPRPMKMPPNPSAHSYDQGVLTQEMIKKWGANEDNNPDPITHPTLERRDK